MIFLRSNTDVIVAVGPFYDKTDGVTIETALTITNERITLIAETDAGSAPTIILDNIAGATAATANDLNYITGGDNGMMQMELAAANVNRGGRMKLSITDAANHVPVFHEFFVLPQAIYDWLTGVIVPLPANVTTWLGTAAATPTVAGVPEVALTHVAGATTNVSALATNVDAILTDTGTTLQGELDAIEAAVITNAAGVDIAADIIAMKVDTAAILVDTGTTLDGRIPAALVGGRIDASVGAMASEVVTATAIAADAIGASELAADAVTEIRSLASGTSDSGTTTTMVDAVRTEADTDYWVGALIVFTSGNIAGQARYITAFTPATDTMTFAPATTQAVATQTYEIWPTADFLRPTTTGRTLDVSTGGEAGIDWANVGSPTTALNLSATNIDADQIVASVSGAVGSVTGAVGSVTGAVGSINTGGIAAVSFAAGAIDAAAIAANAIGASEIATDAIDADALATDAVTEIWTKALAELTQAAPSATPSVLNAIALLYMIARNAVTVTSTTKTFSNDAGVVIAKKSLTDDGTTYTESEAISGP